MIVETLLKILFLALLTPKYNYPQNTPQKNIKTQYKYNPQIQLFWGKNQYIGRSHFYYSNSNEAATVWQSCATSTRLNFGLKILQNFFFSTNSPLFPH